MAEPDDHLPLYALELIEKTARLLFANGQTTERMIDATQRVAAVFGLRATVFVQWEMLTIRLAHEHGGAASLMTVACRPVGIEMGKVAATLDSVEKLCRAQLNASETLVALQALEHRPPISLLRFASMAAAGAVALGVIFGAGHLVSLILIAMSAGLGACLRRWLARVSSNVLAQPLFAALLAGLIGALTVHLNLSSLQRLVAVCPCMILVPGPHFLNGALDLVRGRIVLGAARVGYASMIVLMISLGLLMGFFIGNVGLPPSSPARFVPLTFDVFAAGVAVAAYGTFFSMPWRALAIPIVIGMAAHALRWVAIDEGGASVEVGAFVACLFVGILVPPIAQTLRMPFAAFAFSAVVSLIPGVFLFRMAGGLWALMSVRGEISHTLIFATFTDGATAAMILLAMALGLMLPKMVFEHFDERANKKR